MVPERPPPPGPLYLLSPPPPRSQAQLSAGGPRARQDPQTCSCVLRAHSTAWQPWVPQPRQLLCQMPLKVLLCQGISEDFNFVHSFCKIWCKTQTEQTVWTSDTPLPCPSAQLSRVEAPLQPRASSHSRGSCAVSRACGGSGQGETGSQQQKLIGKKNPPAMQETPV